MYPSRTSIDFHTDPTRARQVVSTPGEEMSTAERDRFVEMAVAIRMFGTEGRMGVSRFCDTQPAVGLSLEAVRARQVCDTMGLGSVAVLQDDIEPRNVAPELRSQTGFPKGAPEVVLWAGHGIFAGGPTGQVAAARLAAILEGKATGTSSTHGAGGRMAGRVVIVTGSAQGFGSGIAEELASEGASIVVADLNAELASSFSTHLCERFGDGCSVFVEADVTSAASIDWMVGVAVRTFGGVDMLVSNAGVLKAGALHEMDERSFDLVTDVNYKAYFLCTRAVASVMKLQHAARPSHFMDIIQINSKSGLEGSNKNFAYAGSKFGGIGLTQSFAKELVDYNIKVNAICPGNYFEGPLWSDPDRGLFVQYLRAGKVPGATTIEDVKKSYTDKVPMKRGCTPRDVARAIYYICEQEYETGQAIPVTGGQVMLS